MRRIMQILGSAKSLLFALLSIALVLICPLNLLAATPQKSAELSQTLPTFPLRLGQMGRFSVGERHTQYQFSGERVLVKANAGWGYASQGTGILGFEAASLVGESAALGLNLNYQRDKLEALVQHMKYWVPSGWRWKGALSYMHGRQSVNFLQTSEKARVSQWNYYGAIDWLDIKQAGWGLQSVGVAVWGGKSKNRSQFAEEEYATETPDYFLITRDHRWLSEGRLWGTALSFQYVPQADLRWVLKGSAGQEWLRYPYKNGAGDSYRKPYIDARVDYQLTRDSAINLGYKYGAVESRVELGGRYACLGLSGFYSQGQNGLDDQYGVILNVDLLALFNKTKQPEVSATNKINRLAYAVREGEIKPLELLQETILRPLPLPSSFMVKVDPTSVKHLRLEKASLPSGSLVTPQGNVYIPVTQGPSVISSAEVNGQPVSALEIKFNTQANQLVVITKNLPDPVNTDTYVVDVEDSLTGDVYRVSFELVLS